MKKKLKKRVVKQATQEQNEMAIRCLKMAFVMGHTQQTKSDLSKELNCKFDWKLLESKIDFEGIKKDMNDSNSIVL